MLSLQVKPAYAASFATESAKDPVISAVMRYTGEGWPQERKQDEGADMSRLRALMNSLSVSNGCLLHGNRVVIPTRLRPQVLELLHTGHFGMVRIRQLARDAVYRPNIANDFEAMCRHCTSCGEHQSKPQKPAVHPWMLPEKPWSRLHIDHAIIFLGSNWLVLTDTYSKYLCIHPTQAVTAKATMDLLEQDFAHFGYPHSLVTDNATAFTSDEFQSWCKERGTMHLIGAPYHPATNGAAERLVQTFKQALKKSDQPPRQALQEFLIHYRRTPTSNGFSPSEMLNGTQIRTKIDTLLPSPAHIAQGKQAKEATKSQQKEDVAPVTPSFKLGDTVYALYFGPRRDREPRWAPAVIIKRHGTRSYNVKVIPNGPTWRRHLEQLHRRYRSMEDREPAETTEAVVQRPEPVNHPNEAPRRRRPPLTDPEFTPALGGDQGAHRTTSKEELVTLTPGPYGFRLGGEVSRRVAQHCLRA